MIPNMSSEEMWQRALAAQMPNAPKPTTSIHEEVLAEKRERNRQANWRYRHSPKGKASNARQCRRYFVNHREQCQGYVIKYKANFLETYGVTFGAWDYWRRKLLAGKCTEEQIPPAYELILADWKKRQELKNQGIELPPEEA